MRPPVHRTQPPRERYKDAAQQRHYNSTAWKKLRAIVRAQQPICQMCGREPSAVVDHINADWRDNRMENLRGLCVSCNASHTARQHREKQR
jgi:5-methylcytosine-specific restriction endonuclease McrA